MAKMKKVKIAINGFGRIGRAAFKIALTKPDVEVVGINDLTDTKTLAYLLQYDTMYGRYGEKVTFDQENIIIKDKKVRVYAVKDPKMLPWKDLGVDVVLECTGRFTDLESSKAHVDAGAKIVIISAPVKGSGVPTLVLGVNAGTFDPVKHKVISNASCTTNCISPVAEVMHRKFGVLKAMMTTVHSYTADQNLVDGPHKDLRRARAAAQNIVPTTTGAAIATTETIPELKGLFDGLSVRVPTAVVSLSDFTFLLKKKTTVEEINKVLVDACKEPRYKNIMTFTKDPVVSSDFIGSPYSSIVDLSLTKVVDGDMVKVVAWYDNEFGYSNRLVELAEFVGAKV